MAELIGRENCGLAISHGMACTNEEYLSNLEEAVVAANIYREIVESGGHSDRALRDLADALSKVYKNAE